MADTVINPNAPGVRTALTGTYSVKALALHKAGAAGEKGASSGELELVGYVAFVVLSSNRNKRKIMADYIVCEAVATWSARRICPTPEEAMAYYFSCEALLKSDPDRSLPHGRYLRKSVGYESEETSD